MRLESPVMKRFTPVMGSITVAAISFHSRPRPVLWVSRTSQAARWNISPRAIPPSVVLMKSFNDAWFVSPKYSQVELPKAVRAADS